MGNKKVNPLVKLGDHGQSPWLDYIRRSLLESGELSRMIENDGLKGLTSNPSIFEKAISGSNDYDDFLEKLRSEGLGASELYERLAIRDIQDAADVMKPVYERAGSADGFVSIEVSPHLAKDTGRTLEEARRLWRTASRPNVMVKVPGTEEGLPAIEALISEGINVNVTLLFSRSVYERVIEAYLKGLEKRAAAGDDVSQIASVASFFVSRIDNAVDELVKEKIETSRDPEERMGLESLLGAVAIANAKLAYQIFKRRFRGDRWEALKRKGAQKQRLLWASTSTKDPSYPDTLYVDALVGPETVNTMPMATMDAYRDHGDPEPRLETGLEEAEAILRRLEETGISLERVTDELTEQGVDKFADAFDKLLNALDERCRSREKAAIARSSYRLPPELKEDVEACLEDWRVSAKARRLWERDSSLWTNDGESEWLGWLGLTEESQDSSEQLRRLADRVRAENFRDAVVLGMGGSSLCPEVLARTFGSIEGFPSLHVLDSTDPAQVRSLEERIALETTLFIVSSKSGTTLEPNIFMDYFYHRVRELFGAGEAGRRFIAVTDPGSPLESTAKRLGFLHVYHGLPSVGGRYSALSHFGTVPAAAMGLDVVDFLERADVMAVATSSCVPIRDNPGVKLGAVLGTAANRGRDKLTLVLSPGLSNLGAWLEQLLAESTGKDGKAIIPVDRESLGPPAVYGDDRIFVYVRLETDPDSSLDRAVEALADAGQPVVRIPVADTADLGQEFFRWEIATAVAGSVMGIHPFNQPDVEASKVATRKLTEAFEKTGHLPEEKPILEDEHLSLFTDERNAADLTRAEGERKSPSSYLRAHLERLGPGDYLALLAFIEMKTDHEEALQSIRHAVRDGKRVATCLGFGPRFLHSTGQAYKGGPDTGVFLQITCDDAQDLPVPGKEYTFGVVKAAQARGDLEVLAQRGRRALRVHLGPDVSDGLRRLEAAVKDALR